MAMLALNIQMHGKVAVVIGGGSVALRKLRALLTAGASVTVVAMNVSPEIVALAESGALAVRVGNYESADLDDAFLAIAATDDTVVNKRIAADARERGILAAVVDNPAEGNCTFPAMLRRADLEIAVSTGGRCPTFATDVRDCIAGLIGPEYGGILEQLAGEREKLLTNGSPSTYNTHVLRSLARRLLAKPTENKES
ncbi:MAG: bifunctional precorrin-2 dehydrogenase/sirohydrochlorin ferrochelatase [Desulfuromonadaceae bacterium]|nr:bifunctional precorrin-2 dehydrogenase/sirohydrochlorin ferrochelatase [Desulfuromonadaceae bacterium]MDD2847320.1 bifunctional precorrin-2 dehydrogenase/sirohydrochlorin ferrochelatase [Desulfuromonadaceae bacterium]MDD4130264.1 bifunctional precorrin-2 dehydrogenase/sirohydrochlorin ferrochelatase [Desulfuromonadaceae bacterium]